MKFLTIFLYPFALIYGFITAIRNLLYDLFLLKRCKFVIPTICVGNLSYGGTGKTPHVEYLVHLLSPLKHIALLSRGYKRKTKGFILAESSSSSVEIGDEAKQYKTKFPDITVTVCESRCAGVKNILELKPETDCIILDDAFQHRSLKVGLNILLTDYNKLYTRDHVIPCGTLREFRYGAKRADIIVITKCPLNLSEDQRKKITTEINPKKHQNIFFSYVRYGSLLNLRTHQFEENLTTYQVALLLSGIANILPLKEYLIENNYSVHTLLFRDHHQFLNQDLINVKETFNNIADRKAIIITTEKDAMRIETPEQKEILKDLPLYYIPIYIEFFSVDKKKFNDLILTYTNDRKNKGND